MEWEEELSEAEQTCKDLNLRWRILRVPNTAGSISSGIVWAEDKRLEILADRGYVTLFDSEGSGCFYLDVLYRGRPYALR